MMMIKLLTCIVYCVWSTVQGILCTLLHLKKYFHHCLFKDGNWGFEKRPTKAIQILSISFVPGTGIKVSEFFLHDLNVCLPSTFYAVTVTHSFSQKTYIYIYICTCCSLSPGLSPRGPEMHKGVGEGGTDLERLANRWPAAATLSQPLGWITVSQAAGLLFWPTHSLWNQEILHKNANSWLLEKNRKVRQHWTYIPSLTGSFPGVNFLGLHSLQWPNSHLFDLLDPGGGWISDHLGFSRGMELEAQTRKS